jgi:hypothetical protein
MRVSVSLVASLILAPSAVWACCPAARRGEAVRIADQEILVTWDPAAGMEHFVRRASFDTAQTKDFGFLVPTPTQPKLAEADDAAFDRLADLIKPEHVTRYVPDPTPLCLGLLLRSAGAPRAVTAGLPEKASVRVLHEQRIAGYDAVVLDADDAKALTDWLGQHGYDARPEITDWVRPYVAARWKVTGFKYAGAPAEGVRTGAVRMTFKTDRPLFPYRVPSDNRTANGLLRVYFVGPERVAGMLGAAEWHGVPKFSNAVPRALEALGGAVPADELPKGTWLSVFEDHRWPASSDDLYFQPSADKTPIVPAPIVDKASVPIPLDVVAVVAFGFWRLRRRKREGAQKRVVSS